MMRTRKMRSAFTLIELLMVMVVLAVLAAIVIPKFMSRNQQAKEAALMSDLKILRNAVASFQADTGYYPATLTALTSTTAPATGLDNTDTSQTITSTSWHGPYLQATSAPNDPVSGSAFTYSVTSGSVGNITSSATGSGLNGTAYSTW